MSEIFRRHKHSFKTVVLSAVLPILDLFSQYWYKSHCKCTTSKSEYLPTDSPPQTSLTCPRTDAISMSFIRLPICLLALVAALLPQSAVAHTSYDYGIDRNTILKRQASNFYAITGIHAGSGQEGSAPIRHEIRKLEQDNTTWALYILGLDMLQYTNQTEMLSWYQIAGISVLGFYGTIADQPLRHSWTTLPSF